MLAKHFRVNPNDFLLDDCETTFTGDLVKSDANKKLEKDIKKLQQLQDRFYADGSRALLVIFQALDAAGKDSTIKRVMSGVNPAGCDVHSFKSPSSEELRHDFMWRQLCRLPERGRIGIFNRSYYEEVLVLRVRPEFLAAQRITPTKHIWKERFEDINNIERYLTRNGTHILKFFLNVSKEEQKARFLSRIQDPTKNWKFELADLTTRSNWDAYREAYQDMLVNTSTSWAPWYVIPADNKWFMRMAVADLIVKTLEDLNPEYPAVTDDVRAELVRGEQILDSEW